MPSITKAKLDELTAEAENFKAGRDALRQRLDLAEAKIRTFDDILDKVKRAAQGQPLSSRPPGGGYGPTTWGEAIHGEPRHKIKTEERQAQEIRELNEHIAALRARIAAVVAVAEFAREHKA